MKGITLESPTKITIIPDNSIVRVTLDRSGSLIYFRVWLNTNPEDAILLKGSGVEIMAAVDQSEFRLEVLKALKKMGDEVLFQPK